MNDGKSHLEIFGLIMNNEKIYFKLSDAEIKRKSKLTKKEFDAIEALKEAVKNLPHSICIDIEPDGMDIGKRITPRSAMRVSFIRKKSLNF